MHRLAGMFLLAAASAVAQSQSFDVVSIKEHQTDDFRQMRFQVLPGGRFSAKALPLRILVVSAYELPFNMSERLTGLPDWANRTQYDIEAKPPDGAFPPGMASSASRAKLHDMMQRLLADRFKLAIRREIKDMPVYMLTVAAGGPKMKPGTILEEDCTLESKDPPGCHEFMGGQGRGLHAKAVNMHDLAAYIENWTDHPVIDRTGLSGLYSMDTDGWVPVYAPPAQPANSTPPNPPSRPNGDGDPTDPTRPTIFMVMRRLGLDLKQQKGQADIYVVEHLEKPSGN